MDALSVSLPIVTVEELKTEAAKLPPDARFALAEWIECSDDVRALRHDALVREIQHGLEQADRGELLEADEVFARLRGRQQASA
jgi:predicted transcriptional regulator